MNHTIVHFPKTKTPQLRWSFVFFRLAVCPFFGAKSPWQTNKKQSQIRRFIALKGLLSMLFCHIRARSGSKLVVNWCTRLEYLLYYLRKMVDFVREYRIYATFLNAVKVLPWQTNKILCIQFPRFLWGYYSTRRVWLQLVGAIHESPAYPVGKSYASIVDDEKLER